MRPTAAESHRPSMADARSATPALAAIVLAAGRGARFGGPKLIALLDGRPLVVHVVEALRAARPGGAPLAEVVVVTGFHAEAVEAALAAVATASAPAVRLARNPDPGRGIASSLATGLAALEPAVEAAIVVLGDQPRISPTAIEALAERRAATGAAIVVPRYAGGGGPNPVLLARRAWPLAAALEGDIGMRAVITAHPELVEVVDVRGANPDVDTAEDLAAL